MDTLHTPGRMTFKADGEANQYSMLCDTGRWWLALLHNGEAVSARQVENMRRLAACWNACDGLDTGLIEGMGPGGFVRAADRMHAERMANAATRRALEALTEWGCTHTGPNDPNSPHTLLIAARAALDADPSAPISSEASQDEPVTPVYTWRMVASGACIYVNSEGADVGHVYQTQGGMAWCADPWGRERNHYNTRDEAKAHVERAFRR